MPIYEYACGSCGHHLEVRQGFSDAPLTKCPACSRDTLERILSQSSFALKGAGWYADGYGAKKGGDSGSKPAAETPKADPKPDKKGGD